MSESDDLVDDELARLLGEAGGARDRDGAADDGERNGREHRDRGREAEHVTGTAARTPASVARKPSSDEARAVTMSPRALARHLEVERAFEHDQDEPERADDRHDRVDPVEVQAQRVEHLARDEPGDDQQHDARAA